MWSEFRNPVFTKHFLLRSSYGLENILTDPQTIKMRSVLKLNVV
jgi:hypothetical protein